MAVYQISRIQIRRGQANAGTGLPQLASGEMAWAIDTQELYIGSGAVSEGAPAVSNIKIITEQDLSAAGNILSTVQYIYKSTDASITTGSSGSAPILRNINSKLDDNVTVKDFGAIGDGATDDTAALQRAIYQLFLNPSNPAYNNTASGSTRRVQLNIPAGTYYTTSTLYIPSFATISGIGIDKTIIDYHPTSVALTASSTLGSAVLVTASANSSMIGYAVTGTGIQNGTVVSSVNAGVSLVLSLNSQSNITNGAFTVISQKPAIQFINDSSSLSSVDPVIASSTTQPRKINLKNITVKTATGVNVLLKLNSVRDSLFENIHLNGGWTSSNLSTGIFMDAVSNLVTCEHNIFTNITSTALNYVVYARNDILHNTFENCNFENAVIGFALGLTWSSSGTFPYGPRQTSIINTKFFNIKQQAVRVDAGTGNLTRNCKFYNVGNNGGSNAASQFAQVYYATYGNNSISDISDRHSDLYSPSASINPTFALVPYVPEVAGHGSFTFTGSNSITLVQTGSTYIPFLKIPLNWIVTPPDRNSGPAGTIGYKIDYIYNSTVNVFTRKGTLHISADVTNRLVTLADEYDYINATTTNMLTLDFQVGFVNKDGIATTVDPWTIVISYQNTQSAEQGVLNYTYSSIF